MVPLEDLSGVIVPQSRGGRARNVEKQIHSHGEVCRVNKSRAAALNQFPDAIDLSMPAGGADDHILARRDTGLDMADNTRRSGEIDHHINFRAAFRGESRAGGILSGAYDLNCVPAPARNFRHQRSRLSAAKKKNVHINLIAEITEKCRGVRGEASGIRISPSAPRSFSAASA